MPSKALLRPVEVLDGARALPGVARMLSGSLDVEVVLERRDNFTHRHDDSGQVKWASDHGIDVIRGGARLAGEKTVEVTTPDGDVLTLHAREAVVTGYALLTYMSKYQARIAGDVIAARAEGRSIDGVRYRDVADHDMVPAVIFADPQVASVGLSEAQARERAIDVEALEYDLASIGGAHLLRDDYEGRAKLVVDRVTDTLVGATFVGPEVAELLHAATVAVVGKVPLETLWHAVPSYPTVSEIWLRLLESR